ncbi:hypothetical protein CBL_05516 [Carabus blaptoides fortunei]
MATRNEGASGDCVRASNMEMRREDMVDKSWKPGLDPPLADSSLDMSSLECPSTHLSTHTHTESNWPNRSSNLITVRCHRSSFQPTNSRTAYAHKLCILIKVGSSTLP